MKKLLYLFIFVIILSCATREIVYIDKQVKSPCVMPTKDASEPPLKVPIEVVERAQAFFTECTDEVYIITDLLQKSDIDTEVKTKILDKIITACDNDVKVFISLVISNYAAKLAKQDAYSQKWEVYGKCVLGEKNESK